MKLYPAPVFPYRYSLPAYRRSGNLPHADALFRRILGYFRHTHGRTALKSPRTAFPHLTSALVSTLFLILAGIVLPGTLQLVARRGTGLLVVKPGLHKDLGVLLQAQAFRDPYVLPVYGSSELALLPYPTRPDIAFSSGGAGFQVCTVGRGGDTSLVMAEKLAALGREIAGKKLVVIVSYPWFLRPKVWPEPYAGNFSELQAARIATSRDLGAGLSRRFAARMLDFSETLREHPSLERALIKRKEPEKNPGVMSWLKTQGLYLQSRQLMAQDYACTLADLMTELPHSGPLPDFDSMQAAPPESLPGEQEAAPGIAPPPLTARFETGSKDDKFAAALAKSQEWADFELLLDTLVHFKARPLVITIPMDGTYEDQKGVSQRVRSASYYDRVAKMCFARGISFESLREQEYNPAFLHEHRSHLSSEGWPTINRLLDAFYHSPLRPLQTTAPMHTVSMAK